MSVRDGRRSPHGARLPVRLGLRLLAAGAALVAAVIVSANCSRAPAQGDALVLLSSRSFDPSSRVAQALDRLVADTDILGPARFEIVAAPEVRPDGWAAALSAWDEARDAAATTEIAPRAVIALVGDLSVLTGVDPSIPERAPDALTSRVVDESALDASLERLARAAERLGGPLVLASAPIGKQGRIEVPELDAVVERIAGRPGFIDLRPDFRERERERLFTNGIDRLSTRGQQAFARALFVALCAEPAPIAARTDAERRARAQARALLQLAQGQRVEAAASLAASRAWPLPAVPTDPADRRAAVRDAALTLALEGPGAARRGWSALADAEATPGLALACRFIMQQAVAPSPAEPFEAALVAVLDAVRARDPQAALLAKRVVAQHPRRIEAWMLLELAGIVASPPTEVRREARAQLALEPHAVVPFEVADTLLDDWPRCLDSLPALYLASQPFADADAAITRP